MPYHQSKIPKGIVGEVSKIKEEVLELEDAMHQRNPVMALVELSDICAAISEFLEKYHPSLKIYDIIVMSEATRSAFKDGSRK